MKTFKNFCVILCLRTKRKKLMLARLMKLWVAEMLPRYSFNFLFILYIVLKSRNLRSLLLLGINPRAEREREVDSLRV